MSRLLLLRHARASWPQPGAQDFDRSLTESGRENAAELALKMAESGLLPDSVLCSSALRAAETWQILAAKCPGVPVTYSKSLYTGDVNAYLTLIQSMENSENLLIVGHNPMLEDLALALSVNHEPAPRKHLVTGFPTCGLAVFDIDGQLSGVESKTARLSQFCAPQMV